MLEGALACIESGDLDGLASLLDAGLDPNAAVGPDGWPLLVVAVEHRQGDAVRLLLDRGADPNRAAPDGWTALHNAVDVEIDGSNQAAIPPHTDLVELLLEHGADRQRDATRTDEPRSTSPGSTGGPRACH